MVTTQINQQQLHHHQSLPSSSSPNSVQQQQQQQQSTRVQATNVKGTKKRVSKPDSVGSGLLGGGGGGGVRIEDMINSGVGLGGGNIGSEFMNPSVNIRSGISGHNSSPPQPPSPPQFQTQLVPIQKFSFFKLEINVDTLVRLFIVA